MKSLLFKSLRNKTAAIKFFLIASIFIGVDGYAMPAPAAPGDDPCSATALTVGTSCSFSSFTTSGATSTAGVPAPGCANYAGGDVWFSMVVPAGGSILLDAQSGGITDGGMAAYSGSCGSLSLISCDDDGSANGLMPSLSLSGLTAGSTIYVRFWEYGNDNPGTFSICASSPGGTTTGGPPGTCATSDPFCTGSSYTFPASTNTTAQAGPYYGCLLSQPNPAWYYLQVNSSGNIDITMSSSPARDIDFIAWGPFSSVTNACNNLTAGTDVDCSYSVASSEICNIPNAVAGQYYMLCITNYSNTATNITFSQTGGTGTTNCAIVCTTAAPVAIPASRCGTGTVSLDVSGCAGTVKWYSAATGGTALFTGTPFVTPSISTTTTYYASCTANGCESPRTAVTATITPLPTPPTTTPGSRCGTGTVTLGAAGCAGGTINWYANSTGAAGGASLGTGASFTTPSISATTTYYATCTVGSCVSTTTAAVATINTNPASPTMTGAARCGTGTVTLTAAGCAGGTINWYANSTGAAGGASLGTGTSFTTPSISATTTYYATCTIGTCVSTTAPAIATINPVPTAGFSPVLAQCAPASFSFTNTGTSSGATYSWTFASGSPGTSTAQNPSGIAYANPGTYAVTQTVTLGTCTATSTQNITVNPIPIGTITAQTNVLCNGGSTGSVTVAGSGSLAPYTYSSNGTTFQGSGTFSGLAAGSYTITVRDANGCITTVPVTITQPTVLTGAITAQTNVLCNGASTGSVTVAGSNGTPGYTYSINGTTFQASGTFTGLAAGGYTITVKDLNNCIVTVPVTITQPTVLTGSITAQTNVLCFGGSTGSVTVAGNNGTPAYTYSSNGTTFQASGTFTGLAAGSYTITVKDNNGCLITVPVTITQPTQVTVSGVKTDATCGQANGTLTATGSNGTAPYTYSIDGVIFQASGNFTTLLAGTYTVTVKDANNCTSTTSITINDLSGLTASITAQVNATCFGGNNGSVTVAGAGSVSPYTYSIDGTTFQAGGTFGTLAAGTYTITVKDANNCTITVPVTITEPSAVTGSITTQTNVLCNGASTGSVTVSGNNGTPGYTYSIDGTTFQASGTFGSLAAGSYTITVKDNNNCIVTVPVTITQPVVLTGSITAQINVLCFGEATGSVTVTGVGGTSPYTYSSNGTTFQASGTFGSLAAGSYTITVKDVNNCIVTVPVTITEPSQVTVTVSNTDATCGMPNGSVTATGANGTPPYTYSVNGTSFQASGIFPAMSAGTYTVTVKDANNCTNTASVTINDLSGLSGAITAQTNVNCAGGNNGSVTVAGSGSTGPYSYAIDGVTFQASGTFGTLTAGNYVITVKDANNCTITVSVTITESLSVTGSITAQTDVLCNGGSDGSVTVLGASGTPGYTYSIDGTTFQASGAFGSLAAGSYTVTVKDVNNCTVTVPVVIIEPAMLTGSITAQTNILCNGASTGEVTVTGSNGTPGYTYSIDGTTFQASGTFSSLAAGSFVVTVKDLNNCTVTVPVVITEPAVLSVTAIKTDATCGAANGSVTATGAGGTPSYSYSIDGTTFQSSNTFGNLASGSYTVTIKDVNNCISTVSISVNDLSGLIGSIDAQVNVSCFGGSDGSVTVSGSGSTGPYTYSSNGSTFVASGTFSSLAAGSYTITVKDANGCTSTVPVTITEPSALSGSITAQTNVLCFGSNEGSVTVTGSNGTPAYTYAIDGVTFQASGTFTSLVSGSYTVTVKDLNNCTFIVPVVITEPTALTAAISSQTDVQCNGSATGEVTVLASNATPAYSYAIDGVTFQAGGTFTGLAAGTYTITVQDANSCVTTVPVTIIEPTQVTVSASSSPATCGQANGSVTATGADGTAPYSYSIDGVNFQSSGSFGNLTGGTYTITIQDAYNCSNTTSVTVNDLSGLLTSITAQTNVSCNGGNNGSVTVAGSGSVAPYTYSIDGVTFLASGTFSGLMQGNYTITVKDANGCIQTQAVTITEPTLVGGSIVSITNVACNGGSTGSIIVAGAGGTPGYTYSKNGVLFQAGGAFGSLAAGSYTITVKDNNGCLFTIPAVVTEPPVLAVVSSSVNAICTASNGSATATPSGGSGSYTYLWNSVPAQTTQTALNLPSGNYTISVTDSNNCSTSLLVTVGADSGGTASISTFTDVSCFGGSDGQATVSMGGSANPPYTYSWSGSSSTAATATGLAAGSYTVTVTDTFGCVTNATATIAEPIQLSVSTSHTDVSCNAGTDGTVTTTVSGGTLPYSYSWLPQGQTTPDITSVSAGTYTVSVTDAKGCQASSTSIITEPSAIVITQVSITHSSCGQPNGSVTVDATGGTGSFTYSWSNTQTGITASGLSANTYTVTATDGNGCSSTAPFTIIDQNGPSIVVSNVSNVGCFGGTNGSATVTVSGGLSPYTYSWSYGANNNPIATGLAAGLYTVAATDANGCVASTSFTISEPTQLVGNTSFTNITCFNSCDGTASITVTGGTAPYSYSWSPGGGTSATITGLCGGTVNVFVTDSNGCSINSGVTLINPLQVITNMTGTDVTCYATCDGTATASPTNGAAPYTYSWDDPSNQTTQTATGLCAGTYHVDITDTKGCTSSGNITIISPAQLVATISSFGNVTCFGNCNGYAQVNVVGGTAPYTYSWTNNIGGNSGNINNLCAGTYTVTVTDNKGCTSQASVTITQPQPVIATVVKADATCYNSCDGSATVTTSGGTSPYTFNWTPSFQNTPTATGLCAGVHNVTVTDTKGCSVVSSITILEPTQLVGVTSVTNSNCLQANGSACVTIGGGEPPYSVAWNDPSSQTSNCAINLVGNTYDVTITDDNNCSIVVTANVNDIQGPTVNIVSHTNMTCYNVTDGTALANINGGVTPYTIQWSGSSQQSSYVTGLGNGLQSITVTDSAGCIGSATVNITRPPKLNAGIGIFPTNNPSCNLGCNGQITVGASGGSGTLTYQWNDPLGQVTPTATGLCAGTYMVVVTDSNGCDTSMTRTLVDPPAINITYTASNVSCYNAADGNINLNTTGGTPPYNYSWSPLVSSGANAAPVDTGVYTVVVNDNLNCAETISITITQPDSISVQTVLTDPTCGNSNGVIALTVTGGTPSYSYQWNDPGLQTTSTASNLYDGTYSALITDNNNCTKSVTATLNDIEGPKIDSLITTPTICHNIFPGTGSAQVYASGGTPGYTYSWSPSSQTAATATGLQAGNYIVTVTDANNCSVTSLPHTVTEPADLIVLGSLDTVICYGRSVGLYASAQGGTPPVTLNWSNSFVGQGPNYVSPTTNTSYTIIATDNNSCKDSVSIQVDVRAPIDIITSPVTICQGEQAVITATATGGYGTIKSFSWDQGLGAGQTHTVTPSVNQSPISYIVTVSDSLNCSVPATDTVVVTINPKPIFQFSADRLAGCMPLSVEFTNLVIPSTVTYSWSMNGSVVSTEPQPTFILDTPGSYDVTLTVTTDKGCDSTETKAGYLTVYRKPVALFTASPDRVTLAHPEITFTDVTTDSIVNRAWSFGDGDSAFINPVPHMYADTGTYKVVLWVENQYSCTDTTEQYIFVDPDYTLYVPKAFTPNGDGKNDVFVPVGVGLDIENSSFVIFDRWGLQIYNGAGLNPWNGKYQNNGELVQQDVYIWILKANNIMGETIEMKGTVTVLR